MNGETQSGSLSRTEGLLVLALCITACAAWALFVGQDTNWDQRNYHIYTAHAWLTGRTTLDVAAAQIQTWLNPLPYVPAYLLIRYAPPALAGAGIGALSAASGLLLWIFARRVCRGYALTHARWCAALVSVLGVSGSMSLSLTGTTFTECVPFVLAALLLVVSDRYDSRTAGWRLFGAGCSLGMACGLKLTNLVYLIGLTVTLLVLWPLLRHRIGSLLAYAAGAVAGFGVTGGYWAAKLWRQFENPVFPFFNGIFQSPYYAAVNFKDSSFVPTSYVKAALAYPFEWATGQFLPSNPLFFRELRFVLVAVVLPIAMASVLIRHRPDRPTGQDDPDPRVHQFWTVSVFFAVSYVLWLVQFGAQRYIAALEALAGVVLLVALGQMLRNGRAVAMTLGVMALATLLWTRPSDWTHVPYGTSWYGINHAEDAAARTLYIMTGWEPITYVIPSLPSAARFARISGNLPLEPDTPLGQRVLRVIHQHDGPLRSLAMASSEPEHERLARFGLQLEAESCRMFQSRLDTLRTCQLTRLPSSRVPQ